MERTTTDRKNAEHRQASDEAEIRRLKTQLAEARSEVERLGGGLIHIAFCLIGSGLCLDCNRIMEETQDEHLARGEE